MIGRATSVLSRECVDARVWLIDTGDSNLPAGLRKFNGGVSSLSGVISFNGSRGLLSSFIGRYSPYAGGRVSETASDISALISICLGVNSFVAIRFLFNVGLSSVHKRLNEEFTDAAEDASSKEMLDMLREILIIKSQSLLCQFYRVLSSILTFCRLGINLFAILLIACPAMDAQELAIDERLSVDETELRRLFFLGDIPSLYRMFVSKHWHRRRMSSLSSRVRIYYISSFNNK
jgi:hypothetical protein